MVVVRFFVEIILIGVELFFIVCVLVCDLVMIIVFSVDVVMLVVVVVVVGLVLVLVVWLGDVVRMVVIRMVRVFSIGVWVVGMGVCGSGLEICFYLRVCLFVVIGGIVLFCCNIWLFI